MKKFSIDYWFEGLAVILALVVAGILVQHSEETLVILAIIIVPYTIGRVIDFKGFGGKK